MGAPGGDGGCVGFGAWRDVAGVAGLRVGDGAAGADVLGLLDGGIVGRNESYLVSCVDGRE